MNADRKLLEDIFEWDVVNWSVAIDFWKNHLHVPLNGAQVLEIGAHNGGLSLWLALQGANVICSDARDPVDRGLNKHKRYGVTDKISYEKIDARHIPYKDYFDIVVFKSLLGGVRGYHGDDAHFQVISSILKSLKPGGQLLFAENLEGSSIHRYARKQFVAWGDFWKYLKISELPSLFVEFTAVEFMTCGFTGSFGRKEWQRRILGCLDKRIFAKFLPPSWRYIAIGVATKARRKD